MIHFLGLPAEIHLHVGGNLPSRDLPSICLTSMTINPYYTSALYKSIDLSYGADRTYREDLEETDVDDQRIELTPEESKQLAKDSKCYKQQLRFRNTLIRHPTLAKCVHSLKWTVSACFHGPHPDGLVGCDFPELWDLFIMLANVNEVELSQDGSIAFPKEISPSGHVFFPNATSVTIKGFMSGVLAHAILIGRRPSQLLHLHLHNIRLYKESYTEEEWEDWGAVRGPPDVKYMLLDNLRTQCTSLKSIRIEDTLYHEVPSPSKSSFKKNFGAYAFLLLSVKSTVETFLFDSRRVVSRQPQLRRAFCRHFNSGPGLTCVKFRCSHEKERNTLWRPT